MIAARISYSADFKNNLTKEQVENFKRSEGRRNALDDLRHGVLKILEHSHDFM